MDPISVFLLTVAGIFLVGVAGELVFQRTQVPDAVWLVAAGIVLGPVTGLLRQDLLREIAPFFAALTLVVILFEGGRRLRLESIMRSAPHAVGVAILTFLLSCVTVALVAQGAAAVGWLPAPWTVLHSLLLGTILGGSSSVVVMPSMAMARVESRVADVVSLESAITDILCVVGAGTIAQLIARGPDAGMPGAVIVRTFGIGLGIGAGAGLIWVLFLGLLRQNAHAFPLTLSALLILYVLVDRTGGSPALAVLTFAILAGNAAWIGRRLRFAIVLDTEQDGRDFHGQLVFIVKSFFFTFIGAMLGPPWGLAVLGVLAGLVLLPSRLPGAWFAAWTLRLSPAERGIVAVSLPRGLAAGVLATLPAAAGIPGTAVLPVVVFPAVVTTIVVFAVGFPLVRPGGKRGREGGMAAHDQMPATDVPSTATPTPGQSP
jgi:cell volume regulation protein A